MTHGIAIDAASRLDPADIPEVLDLIASVTHDDGVSPLSEHVILHLRHGGDLDARHLRARDHDGTLVGYAHLDATDAVEGASAELAVASGARGHGVGSALVEALIAESPDGRLRVWARGGRPESARLMGHLGFTRSRTLWQMRRSLLSSLPDVVLPPGVILRSYDAQADAEAWVAVNAAAFVDLPDQGGWTIADLRKREAEPWFDPAGFLIAVDASGEMAGFHWTKIHGARHPHGPGEEHDHAHDPIGEVYVVGVSPRWRGSGLGRALVVAGLQHLRSAGLGQAMLYVDADNLPAITLYESLGFTRWDSDVLYRR